MTHTTEPQAELDTGAVLEAEPERERAPRRRSLGLLVAGEKREAMTVTVAARLLGVSQDTLYRWLNEGRLRGRKVGGRWIVYRDSVDEEWRSGLVVPNAKPRR